MAVGKDGNYRSIVDTDWALTVKKTVTYDGGTANDPGDFDGTGNPQTLFTVTGDVVLRVFGVCTTNLAGASATLEVGTTKSTAALIPQTTATDIDASELWHDATPDTDVEASTVGTEKILVGGADIIATVGTANITGGVVEYICAWYPLSENGKVVAA